MELKYDSPGSAVSGLTQKYFTTFCTVRTSLEDCLRYYMIDLHKKGHLVSVCVELWLLAVFVSTMHVCVCGAFQGYQCLESSSSTTAKVNSNVISTLERKLGDSRTACCIINTCRESTLTHSQVTSLDNTNLKEQLSTFLKEGFG